MGKLRHRTEMLNVLPRVTQQLSYKTGIQTSGRLPLQCVLLCITRTTCQTAELGGIKWIFRYYPYETLKISIFPH